MNKQALAGAINESLEGGNAIVSAWPGAVSNWRSILYELDRVEGAELHGYSMRAELMGDGTHILKTIDAWGASGPELMPWRIEVTVMKPCPEGCSPGLHECPECHGSGSAPYRLA